MPFSPIHRISQSSQSTSLATTSVLLISIGLCSSLAAPLQAQTPTTLAVAKQPLSLNGAKCDETSGYSKNQKYDAVIIGAGLAGLSAAKGLQSHHRSVLILESNDRIGGRAYVGQVGPQKIPIDYGGAWLHDAPQNPLTNLVDKAKFNRTCSHLDVPFYIGSSEALPTDIERFEKAHSQLEEAMEQSQVNQRILAGRLCDSWSIYAKQSPEVRPKLICNDIEKTIPNILPQDSGDLCRQLSAATVSRPQFCQTAKAQLDIVGDTATNYVPRDPEFEQILPLLIANAGPLESSAELRQTSAFDSSAFLAGDDDFVNQGFGTFVEAFGKGLPICLNSAVTKIKLSNQSVEVSVGNRVYTASTALVSISVGVLQSKTITFDPPLPTRKLAAIDHLKMGNMQKVIIPFASDIFFNHDTPPKRLESNSWVLYEGVPPPHAVAFANKERLPLRGGKLVMALVIKPLDTNIAVGFFGGAWAQALEQQCKGKEESSGKQSTSHCDDLSVEITRSALSNIIGQQKVDNAIEVNDIHVTHWSLDPTSFGAYSVAEPGNWDKHAVLAEPVADAKGNDRLFFAGEATAIAKYNGSYPGAHKSGLEAADKINATLSNP
jgi:monoamine oxidase